MKLIKTEKVNTCNAWGFGGWIGLIKTYDNGLILREGKNYFRHAKPEGFTKFSIEYDGREITFSNVKNPKHKYILILHCVTPDNTWKKSAMFSENKIEPYSETLKMGDKTYKFEYEIVKIIKL